MVTFSHLDPGTLEAVWRDDGRLWRAVAHDCAIDDLIVVAAHPDDETLGAAGLIHRVHEAGGRITVVVATDGEGSHPDSSTHTPEQLARLRRREVVAAIGGVAAGADIRFLGLADGALREHIDILAGELRAIIDSLQNSAAPGARRRIVTPWSGDAHRDHRVIAETVRDIAAAAGILHEGYPIWLWHWGTPADLPWERVRSLRLSPVEAAAKRRALRSHPSQTSPLSPAPGDEAVLHAGMREHFERDIEVFIEEAPPAPAASISPAWFQAFYGRHDDPWGFETRWYEHRKRDVLLAALPTATLGRVLEIGCATGLISQRLAERADLVVALDPVEAALERARCRCGDDDRVSFVRGQIPEDWPDGRFDTIVMSEVGYYLSPRDLTRTIELVERCLTDYGCFVACHWRLAVVGYPQNGDEVHAMLRRSPRLQPIVRHEEKDFLLEVFSLAPALSVAQREGIA